MAYSDFTVTELMKRFGVKFRAENLFEGVKPIEPTVWLSDALRKSTELGFGSEKSRSERLVTPILLELSDLNHHTFSIYSGMNLDVDESLGLKGECDFMFSFSRIQDFVVSPIFCITEAKKQDLEQGTIQASAQLIGAKKLNEIENNKVETLYGCSTTGIEWRFLKYHHQEIIIDETRYLIRDLPILLGVLQCIIDSSRNTLIK
jgi:hypothetical protein